MDFFILAYFVSVIMYFSLCSSVLCFCQTYDIFVSCAWCCDIGRCLLGDMLEAVLERQKPEADW